MFEMTTRGAIGAIIPKISAILLRKNRTLFPHPPKTFVGNNALPRPANSYNLVAS